MKIFIIDNFSMKVKVTDVAAVPRVGDQVLCETFLRTPLPIVKGVVWTIDGSAKSTKALQMLGVDGEMVVVELAKHEVVAHVLIN